MPRIGQPVVGLLLLLVVLGGCAVQADRTRELLELDLADRSRAMAQLERDFQREPAAWQAYSLGVLHGAEGDYTGLNQWFERCGQMSNLYDEKIISIRSRYWRDEARRADALMAGGQWAEAAEACERALLADPGRHETRLRLVEARVLAWGPQLEEIRTLAGAGRLGVVDRWLEARADNELDETALDVRVRLQAQLGAIRTRDRNRPGDAEAAFVIAELSRLAGDWVAMDRWYTRNAELDSAATRQAVVTANRRDVADRYLTSALAAWGADHTTGALACLDTADLADPDRADIALARRNMELLAIARSAPSVRSVLATGELNDTWLLLWTNQLWRQDRRGDAAIVATALLGDGRTTDAVRPAHEEALRLRAAWRIETQDLPGAAADLRRLLMSGGRDTESAVVLGDVLLATSHYAEALHWYDKAADWGATGHGLDRRRACAAFGQGNYASMLIHAERAVAAAPDDAESERLLIEARQLVAARQTGREVRP